MKEKKPFVANKNHFYVFIGLFLCLISIILVLNVGPVARVLSTPFTFSLGWVSYFLYLAINILGLRMIFAKKFFRLRFNSYFFASIILFISILMIVSHFAIMADDNIGGRLLVISSNETDKIGVMEAIKLNFGENYMSATTYSLFDRMFGAGISGHFLVAVFNSLFGINNGGLIFSIVLMAIAILIYFLPLILRLMGQTKEKKPASKQVEREERETVSDISQQKQNQQRVKNIDVVKHASEIDVDNYESEIMGAPKRSATMSSPTFNQQINGAGSFGVSENGLFAPAKFINLDQQYVQQQEIPQEPQQAYQEQPVNEPTPAPQQVEQDPVQEQLQLDFDAAPEFNEDLVKAKPVFQEPTMVPPVQPQPAMVQPQPQPVVEQPKPRERVKWIQPSTEVLNTYEISEALETNRRVADERKLVIDETINNFGVGAHVEDYTIGPSVTRFNISYDRNVSSRSVSNLVQDIQIRLGGVSARFESIVEGQSTSGLEIPNATITTVSFKDVYEALPDVKKHPLAVAFGKNIKGDVIYADFDEFPHALVAGTTGSGKSIFINSIIVSLIMRNSPDDLKMVLVDPKKVEMSRYKDMPHLLCPIITEAQEAKALMVKLCEEMERRYGLFSENGCSNIREFNEDAPGLGLEKLPYIMIFFDEYADMVDQCKEISMPVVSIAQKARACGIHMCIATQRPSTNVVTGVIKANLPTHVALMMASAVDSVTIIGEGGAEKLIGKGDMLVQSPLVSRVGVVRLQGCFIHRQEINRVVGYLKEHYETHYDEKYLNLAQEAEQAANEYAQTTEFKEAAGNSEEERYQAIKEWVLTQEFMSISRIQRECAVGFNRAGRFFLRLQAEGVVGNETEGNKGCRVNGDRISSMSNDVVTSDEQTSFRSDD